MSEDSAFVRSQRAANSGGEEHELSGSGSCRQGRSAGGAENDRGREKYCYWCHEPLPPLPEEASYVDEINHYIHDGCRAERDERNRRTEHLRSGIADGSIDSMPDEVRRFVLDRIKGLGFARRRPCLSRDAVGPAAATALGEMQDQSQERKSNPEYGFAGYGMHTYSEDKDDDAHNRVAGCELCGGSGTYDPLPQLLELTDDKAAEAWVAEELPRSSGPCDQWPEFPEPGWYYDALGYNRSGHGKCNGVTVYNPDRMQGGVITWLEIADLFRPRTQSSLF